MISFKEFIYEMAVHATYKMKYGQTAGMNNWIYKNPTSRELSDSSYHHKFNGRATGEKETGVFLHHNDMYTFDRFGSLHHEAKQHLNLSGDHEPLSLYVTHKEREAHVHVTDANNNTSWHHNPDTHDYIMNHPEMKKRFNKIHISYHDEDIHGPWHAMYHDDIEESRLIRKVTAGMAIAGAVGLAAGAIGGARLGDQHRAAIDAKNAAISQTISQGKKMVDAQKWAREKKIEKATSAALSKPTERIPSEVPKNARSFLDAIEHTRDLDHLYAATIQHYNPKGDDYMKSSRGKVVHPQEYKTGQTPNVTYSGGSKFSMNYKKVPDPVANPFAAPENNKSWGANEEPKSIIGKQIKRKAR